MLDFEGNVDEPYQQTRYLMEPDKEDFSLAAVSALDWDSVGDDNNIPSFQADEFDIPNDVSDLVAVLSCNAGIVAPDDIFDGKPLCRTIDDLEEQFSKETSTTVSAAHADAPKGVKKEVIAKL